MSPALGHWVRLRKGQVERAQCCSIGHEQEVKSSSKFLVVDLVTSLIHTG